MAAIYRGMDRAALDAAYNNTAHVGQAKRDAWVADWTARSARVRESRPHQRDLAYGGTKREILDFIPCGKRRAPTLAFIHGGYWQMGDKDYWHFLAEGPLAHGFNFANLEYTLGPERRMAGIVDEIARATRWLLDNLKRLGGDPARLYVAGHSAGGHLTAIAMENPKVAGGLAISGIYDLEPIRLCYLNDRIGMTPAEARRCSPVRRLPKKAGRLWVTVGGGELPELQRQSVEYFATWRGAGLRGEFVPVPVHDHFSIMEELARPEGRLARALAALASGAPPPS
jgi:acetyl esterase/lipase